MKEHPIIMSGPMVLALLADRKFVTRRLSKRWLKAKAGDRIWVRECYGIAGARLIDPCLNYRADGTQKPMFSVKPGWWRSSNIGFGVVSSEELLKIREGWIPSIHMPRWASRILLECEEDAREERLQDITEEEAALEGVESEHWVRIGGELGVSYGLAFRNVWDSLHTEPGERFEDNPVVVRVGRFRRLT